MRLIALVLLTGCFLPVATGTPESATTVGAGRFGVQLNGEAPTVDLIAKKDDNTTSANYGDTVGQSPAAAMRMTVAYGLGDDTDLEVAAEGELWFFFFPLPTGGSIGLRNHTFENDIVDVAFATRVGGVSGSFDYTDLNGNQVHNAASAKYASVSAVAQMHGGVIRPLASINLMPFQIDRKPASDPEQKFSGVVSSATVGLMLVLGPVQLGPYLTATHFTSENEPNASFLSGGIVLALRPNRDDDRPPK